MTASIEYPNASLADTNGQIVRAVNQVPDVVVRGTWTLSAAARLQGSGVLVRTPVRNPDVGIPYIWGKRLNRSGATGEARQLQVRARDMF